MKGGTLQINWHGTKPVLTLDFHPISGILATGGADFDIKIWNIDSGEAQKKLPTASYQTSLSYHSSAVNVLRFSPCGEYLASGADGGELLLWKMQSTDSGKTWKVLKTLSFHRKDVLDLEWSSDGAFLISGSVDNSCLIWDINKGSVHQILDAHLHYVQGVAWDPLSKYVASLSSDRTCRIYVHKTQKSKGIEKINFVCQHVISKSEQQNADDPKSLRNHLFHDETLPSFFRRLAWSPDGSCLLVPAGSYKVSASMSINTAYVFSRKDLTRPALMLPGGNKPVVAVRFSPLAFSLSGTNSAEFFKLPYQLIFAIATLNSLYIYSSESATPITIYAGLHYAPITDIAWSPDAKYLAVSSQDGYCTLIEFEKGELGTPISLKDDKKVANADSKSPVGPKPEETKMEAVAGSFSVPVECKNADGRVGKQEVPSATSTSVPAVSSCSVPVDGQKADEKAGQQEFPSATSTPVPAVSDCSVPVDGKKADEMAGKKEVLSATSTPVPAVSSCFVPVDGKKADEKAGMQKVPSATSTPVPAVSGCSVSVDSKKADENAGKQEVPTAASTTVPSKPAKRRITPMAVDP